MLKYIKVFKNHSQYDAEKDNLTLPNVSLCDSENEVHFSHLVLNKVLTCTYEAYDQNPTKLYKYYDEAGEEEWWVKGIDVFDKIEIDDVEVSIADIDAAEGNYQLAVGEHVVKYTFKDPTTIYPTIFEDSGIKGIVDIPNSVTKIGNGAFANCTNGFNVVIIPERVTEIGDGAFNQCVYLQHILVAAKTPPTLGQQAIEEPLWQVGDLAIYVPAESIDAYKSAEGWSEFERFIQAIPNN